LHKKVKFSADKFKLELSNDVV